MTVGSAVSRGEDDDVNDDDDVIDDDDVNDDDDVIDDRGAVLAYNLPGCDTINLTQDHVVGIYNGTYR